MMRRNISVDRLIRAIDAADREAAYSFFEFNGGLSDTVTLVNSKLTLAFSRMNDYGVDFVPVQVGLNQALSVAACAGRADVIVKLYQNEYIKSTAADNNNQALRAAMVGGHHNIFDMLLRDPSIKEHALSHYKDLLLLAVRIGRLSTFNKVLGMHRLVADRAEVKRACISALNAAVLNGSSRVVAILLDINGIEQLLAEDTSILRDAIICNRDDEILDMLLEFKSVEDKVVSVLPDVVLESSAYTLQRLLKIPSVRDNAGNNDNEVLFKVLDPRLIKHDSFDIANVLLDIPSVQDAIRSDDDRALRAAVITYGYPINIGTVNRLLKIDNVRNNPTTPELLNILPSAEQAELRRSFASDATSNGLRR